MNKAKVSLEHLKKHAQASLAKNFTSRDHLSPIGAVLIDYVEGAGMAFDPLPLDDYVLIASFPWDGWHLDQMAFAADLEAAQCAFVHTCDFDIQIVERSEAVVTWPPRAQEGQSQNLQHGGSVGQHGTVKARERA